MTTELYRNGAPVTPSDTLTFGPSKIFVGGAGLVEIRAADGGQILQFTVPAGGSVPVLARQVRAATTATVLVRCF